MGALVFYESVSEIATLSNTFKVAGTPTDPTTISLTVTDPNGVLTTYTFALGQIIKDSTGVYHKDVTCPLDGEWEYVWTGTGTAADVQAGTWTVFETTLGHLYATVDALKSRLRLSLSSTSDDYELHAACFAASRAVEADCERHFWRTLSTEVRTFEPSDLYYLKLGPYNDLVSATTLKVDVAGDGTYETTWASTEYQLQPVNPAAAPEPQPYTCIQALTPQSFPYAVMGGRRDQVQITGVFGWPGVPWAIKQAALILAADTFKLKEAPFGVSQFGDLAVRVGNNPRVSAFLSPYRRNNRFQIA